MKASVLIAAKNARSFIADAIWSALNQTETDLEVIVVDDGSSDGTSAVVETIRSRDRRVVLLRNEINKGVSAARNQAIAAAKGDWLAILDADDAMVPHRLEVMIARAQARGLDMLGDNIQRVDAETKAVLGTTFDPDECERCDRISVRYMIERDSPEFPNPNREFGFVKPIVSRAFLRKADVSYVDDVWCGEDFLFYYDCVLAGAKFGLMGEAMYLYTTGHGSALARLDVPREKCRANRIMLQHAKARRDGDVQRLVARRQTHLNRYAFAYALRCRSKRELLLALPTVSPLFALATTYEKLRRSRRRMALGSTTPK